MSNPADHDPKELPLVAHLVELRDRLLRAVICIAIVFLMLFPFANDISNFLSEPMTSVMGEGQQVISTKPLDPFFIPFKQTLMAAFFVSVPYVLYQIWAFVMPGLYQNEIRIARPILASSIMLFYAGILFAYFLVLPLIFAFSVSTSPESVAVMTDISYLYDLEMQMFFVFGFVFEVPIATVLLILAGVIDPDKLKDHRGYVIIACFTIGMIVTPPDVFSQSMVAIPMWLLFESGLFFGKMLWGKGEAGGKADATPQ